MSSVSISMGVVDRINNRLGNVNDSMHISKERRRPRVCTQTPPRPEPTCRRPLLDIDVCRGSAWREGKWRNARGVGSPWHWISQHPELGTCLSNMKGNTVEYACSPRSSHLGRLSASSFTKPITSHRTHQKHLSEGLFCTLFQHPGAPFENKFRDRDLSWIPLWPRVGALSRNIVICIQSDWKEVSIWSTILTLKSRKVLQVLRKVGAWKTRRTKIAFRPLPRWPKVASTL